MRLPFLNLAAVAFTICACSDAGVSERPIGPTLTSITVSFSPAAITAGQSTQATATLLDAARATFFLSSGDSLSWSSSNPSIASVSSAGVVTGISAGSASITATVLGKSGSASLTVAAPTAIPVFLDNFDSGARTGAQGGYRWTDFSSTVNVSTAKPFSGTHSLEFVFGPDALTAADDSDPEQRFQLGAYKQEVWFEYMLFVPLNYFHRAVLGVDDSWNNKFFTLWRDDYSSLTEWRVRIELDANAAGGLTPSSSPLRPADGTSRIRPVSNNSTNGGSVDFSGAQVNLANPVFISPAGPIKTGAWTQLRIHVKAASGLLKNDGQLELWANGVLVYRKTNGDFMGPGGVAEIHNGYLLGYSNSGFTEKTTLYIDDFKIYVSNPGWTP